MTYKPNDEIYYRSNGNYIMPTADEYRQAAQHILDTPQDVRCEWVDAVVSKCGIP